MDDIDLTRLRYFVTVAEELNFSRAATRLSMTQQALSSAIARLERDLGVALFVRTTRRVELAASGRALLAPARLALAAGADAVVAARSATGVAGSVTLGISSGSRYGLTGLLKRVADSGPAVCVHIRHDSARPLLDAVAQGQVDVAAVFAEPVPDGLEHLMLFEEPLVAAVTTGHELAQRQILSLAELREQTLALDDPEANRAYNEVILTARETAGFTPRTMIPRGQHDSWEHAVHRQGCLGLTCVSSLHASHRGLRLIPLAEQIPVPTHLAWRAGSTRRPAMQTVIDAARAARSEP